MDHSIKQVTTKSLDKTIQRIVENIKQKDPVRKTCVCFIGEQNKSSRTRAELITEKIKIGLLTEVNSKERFVTLEEKFPFEFVNWKASRAQSMINLGMLIPFSSDGNYIKDGEEFLEKINETNQN